MLKKILFVTQLVSAEYMFHWNYHGTRGDIDCVKNYDFMDLASKLPASAFSDDPT